MTIQVTGVLNDPVGQPLANAIIRVTALETSSVCAKVQGKITVGITGSYDFQLQDGKYAIEVLQSTTYHTVAYIEVTAGTATPITLEALIDIYSFCEVTAPVCS